MKLFSDNVLDRKRPNTVRRTYMKLWWRRFHFIWDHRNRWVVLGVRTLRKLPYIYRRLGPLNLIVCAVKADGIERDIWLRFFYGTRKEAP